MELENNSSVDSSGEATPASLIPTIVISDYIEMAYLFLIITIGIPSNTFILKKLLKELKRAQKDSVKSGFLLLKLNLNISDLLLLILACGKLIWLYTYEWVFGATACRVFQYLSMMSLYGSANIVVCIAVDRLRNVLAAHKPHRTYRHVNPVKVLTYCSWLTAAVCALPQFFVFDTINLGAIDNEDWYQCSDVWQIYSVTGLKPYNDLIMSQQSQDVYNISHLITVFWGPLTILVICYVLIATRLIQYSIQGVNGQETAREPCLVHSDQITEEAETSIHIHRLRPVQTRSNSKNLLAWKPWRFSENSSCTPRTQQAPTVQFRRGSAVLPVHTCSRPGWRKQMRSKVFRTTLLVVMAHMLFWFPYNALGLMRYINVPLYTNLSEHANIFKDMQFLITLINPFLYGFTR